MAEKGAGKFPKDISKPCVSRLNRNFPLIPLLRRRSA